MEERELGAFERGFLLAIRMATTGAKYTTAEIRDLLGYRWDGTVWNTLRRLRPNGFVVDLDEDGYWSLSLDKR